MRAEMRDDCPSLDVDHATKQFVDYWRAASGRTATKKDWIAAWRFWMRREAERTAPAARRRPTRDDENLAVLAEMQAKYGNPETKGLSA